MFLNQSRHLRVTLTLPKKKKMSKMMKILSQKVMTIMENGTRIYMISSYVAILITEMMMLTTNLQLLIETGFNRMTFPVQMIILMERMMKLMDIIIIIFPELVVPIGQIMLM